MSPWDCGVCSIISGINEQMLARSTWFCLFPLFLAVPVGGVTEEAEVLVYGVVSSIPRVETINLPCFGCCCYHSVSFS